MAKGFGFVMAELQIVFGGMRLSARPESFDRG